MKKKAQMSAPFELLVAVVIMGFVILFGMNALNELNKTQCSHELSNTMFSLVNAIELATNQYSTQALQVKIPACYHNSKLYLEATNSQNLCSAYCIGSRETCILLKFSSDEESRIKCVNINFFTSFPSESDMGCPSKEGFQLVKPTNNQTAFVTGYYVIQNVTSVGAAIPTVCIYQRTQK